MKLLEQKIVTHKLHTF